MTFVDVARERVRGCSLPDPFSSWAQGFAGTAGELPDGPAGKPDGRERSSRMTLAADKI